MDDLSTTQKKTLEEQVDVVAMEVFKHTEDIEWIKEHMVTKDDMRTISENIDVLVGLAKKNDQELTFVGERMKRVEGDVEKLQVATGLFENSKLKIQN